MYALERGLGMKWMGVLFAIFTLLASLGLGNTVQANSISVLLQENYNIDQIYTGLALSALIALVILFGVKGIARVCSAVVPVMIVLYVMGCIYILCLNAEYLGETINLIVSSALSPKAAAGGFIGASVQMAMRYGISRGLFSNESGLGSAPIVAAAAKTRNPVRQALVSSTGTFWDTVVICALTGLVLVSSIIAYPDIDYTQGAILSSVAFSKIPYVGTAILSVGIVTFAFSTILGWSYYAERCIEYLGGQRWILTYRIFWVICIFCGSTLHLNVVWNFSDIANALMAIPNLISLILLSGVIVRETRHYLWEDRLNDVAPPPPIRNRD